MQQTSVFAEALPALGLSGRFETLTFEGQDVGQALVLSRRIPLMGQLRAVLRGPVWESDIPGKAKVAALNGLGPAAPHLIEAETADSSLHAAGYRMVMTPTTTCWLDLCDGAAPAATCHPKWRTSLNRARNANLEVTVGPLRGPAAEWTIARDAAMRRARRYRSIAVPLARAISARLPSALALFSARSRPAAAEIMATMLFVTHGRSATYLLGATSDQGRAQCAHHLLLAEACDLLRVAGVGWLDLGQIDTLANPGLARFKLGTGARPCQLGGSWLRLPLAAMRLGSGRTGSQLVERLKR